MEGLNACKNALREIKPEALKPKVEYCNALHNMRQFKNSERNHSQSSIHTSNEGLKKLIENKNKK